MKATPMFLGACALACVAGVVSGATINTNPIQRAGIGMEEISRPAIAVDAQGNNLLDQVALPDQYAIVTPQGRFEVAELSSRGLYAQRRFGYSYQEASYTPLPEPVEDIPPPLPEPMVENPSDVVSGPSTEPLPPIGEAKMIRVAAELAS